MQVNNYLSLYQFNKSMLIAPTRYILATTEVRDAATNGCGTAGWKGKLVPDTLYFLSILEACRIHDWMYAEGETEIDKKRADDIFLSNMEELISNAFWFLRFLRRRRALKYFLAVAIAGDAAFWADKEKP